MKIAVFYPYSTGEKAFSGGVAKVAVSNIIAINLNGDKPYLVLPKDNVGLMEYVRVNCPYCEIVPVDIMALARYLDTKNIFKKLYQTARNLYKNIHGKRLLTKAFEEIQPDVIHYHETVCFNLLGCYTKCKIVLHLHSYIEISNRTVQKYIYRCISKYANVVLSPTESIKKSREKYLKNIVMVKTPYLDLVSNAPDETISSHFNSLKDEGKILFSFVGRIARIKRLEYFLRSLAKLTPEERKNIKYMVIGGCNTMGDKDYKIELENYIKDNGLDQNVEWVGYVTSVESVLPYVDYGVMLTLSEAMPMVGIEYLKYSIPTIGFDVPGINDFLINEVNGFLIEDKNTEMIASVLRRIINNEHIPNFKETIPETYKGYSVEKFAEALKDVYYQ